MVNNQKVYVTLMTFLLLLAAILITFYITKHFQEKHFANAVSDQAALTKITKLVTPDYSHLNYSDHVDTGLANSDELLYNFGDQSKLTIEYPHGFLAVSSPILTDTINLYPAVGGTQAPGDYMSIMPYLNTDKLTADSYLQKIHTEYTAGPPITSQKSMYSAFAMDYSKPFMDGYTSKKLGAYTCYYYNEEVQSNGNLWCHIFGQNHVLDVMYSSRAIAAGELGPETPAFSPTNAETIIAAIQYSNVATSPPF